MMARLPLPQLLSPGKIQTPPLLPPPRRFYIDPQPNDIPPRAYNTYRLLSMIVCPYKSAYISSNDAVLIYTYFSAEIFSESIGTLRSSSRAWMLSHKWLRTSPDQL